MNWPNFISFGRLLATPVMIWLLSTNRMMAAFCVFLMAGLSDILDGLLARILKDHSLLGAYLDPIADKVLLTGVFITLGCKEWIPLWLVLLVVSRDILIVGGIFLLFVLDKRIVVTPLMVSKINTLLQIILVLGTMGQQTFNVRFPFFSDTVLWLTTLTTILSGISYVALWFKKLKMEK